MRDLSLLDVNKPEVLKQVLNELLAYIDSAEEIPKITKESIGLGNVDNTSDKNKPLSDTQKKYIDSENLKNLKLESEELQEIKSDIALGEDNVLYGARGNGTHEPLIAIKNKGGYENVEVGASRIPLKLFHCVKDINQTTVSEKPKIEIYNGSGDKKEDYLALDSDVKELNVNKVNNNVFNDAETCEGVVTDVSYSNDLETDELNVKIVVRSIKTGNILSSNTIPLKMASTNTRGLMSKEDVAKLSDLISRVAAIEGKASRYLFTKNQKPTAEEIDSFAQENGQTSPYSGVAIVVAGTYHVWHYYENDNIGWRDDGSDTVQQASNTTLGIVKGEDKAGKVYIESDGTMSVVGFDDIKSTTETNSKNMITDISLESGTEKGTLKFTYTKDGKEISVDNVTVKGLGSAAFANTTDFTTSTQGLLAEQKANKVAEILDDDKTNETKYPSINAVVSYVDKLFGEIASALGGV